MLGFFKRILQELHQSVYLSLGGSLDDESFDWGTRGIHFASIALKILILLMTIGLFYWLLVYLLKRSRSFLHLNDRQLRVGRSLLRYLWLILSVLAIMSQVGVKLKIIQAFAKASLWAALFYVAWAMSAKAVHWLLKQYDINESIEQLCRNLLSVFIVIVASGVILAQFGFDIFSLVAGLGIVGLAVGFAAQSTLANFIAGIAILVEQSFGVGDWIRIGNQEGRVVEINLRTTHILNRDNIVIIFPNATVASSEVVNLTSKTFVRFSVMVRTELGSDIATVRSLVLGVLKEHDAVLAHPLAMVSLDKIGEYDLQFLVRFWLAPASVARLPLIQEQLLERIKTAFDGAGIGIPYPHMYLSKTQVSATKTQSEEVSLEGLYAKKDANKDEVFPDGS